MKEYRPVDIWTSSQGSVTNENSLATFSFCWINSLDLKLKLGSFPFSMTLQMKGIEELCYQWH